MRRVWLDFVKPEPGRYGPGWAALVVALALAFSLAIHDMDLNDRISEAEGRVHVLQRTLDRERLKGLASEGTSAAGENLAKQVAARGPSRWEALFTSLEAVADESVTLLSLHPEGGGLTIGGEAKHLAAAVDYLKRLKGRPPFSNAYLADYETVRDHPQRPLRFTIIVPGGDAA